MSDNRHGSLWTTSTGLRSPWRLLGHAGGVLSGVLLWFVVLTVTVFGAGQVFPQVMQGRLFNGVLLWGYGLLCLVLMGVTVLSGWILDKGSARTAGLGGPVRISLYQWVLGSGTGVVLLLPGLGFMALGGFEIQRTPFSLAGIFNGVVVTLLLFSAATIEELLFRGYGFMWLIRCVEETLVWCTQRLFSGARPQRNRIRMGSLWGVSIVFCVLFSLAHAENHGSSTLALFNTFLAGAWLCIALFRSGALWYPIGLHWGWNWGQGIVFGLPVSGNGGREDATLLVPQLMTVRFDGPDWLSGGAYGIEGSVGCTLALAIGCILAWRVPMRDPDARAIPLRTTAV